MTQAPTPENYKQWYQDRIDRTEAIIQKQKIVTGRQIRQDNLSVKYLVDHGYVFNDKTDSMEK